jgi:glycolate oxidase FAD binding subunit
MLPLDPPCRDAATVGGVIATNSSGARRRLYGTARDMVIGMEYATLDGELLQSGGMVVKNVAGLDVQKALIGSFGTLAAITSVNFRLYPLPEASRTFVLRFGNAAALAGARDAVLSGVLQPAALDAMNPEASGQAGLEGHCLLLRAGGSSAVLSRYQRELSPQETLEGEGEAKLWTAVEEFAARQEFVVRCGHPMSNLQQVLESATGACIARAGTGVAYLAFAGAQEVSAWMEATQSSGWSRIIEWAPPGAPASLERWPSAGTDLELMQGMKKLFDPQGLLNRGRLYGRI